MSVATSAIPAPIAAPTGPAIAPVATNVATSELPTAPPMAVPSWVAVAAPRPGNGRKNGVSAIAYMLLPSLCARNNDRISVDFSAVMTRAGAGSERVPIMAAECSACGSHNGMNRDSDNLK